MLFFKDIFEWMSDREGHIIIIQDIKYKNKVGIYCVYILRILQYLYILKKNGIYDISAKGYLIMFLVNIRNKKECKFLQ